MFSDLIAIFFFVPYDKLIGAFLGGLLPVLIWLWFLEHEDVHPEPKKVTFYAFVAGMITVIFVIPPEGMVRDMLLPLDTTILLWATIEESFKFIAAALVVLWRKENDEPIDSMMYLIAVALGFAAVENSFFILDPLLNNGTAQAIITGNFRFIGATLVHVVSSSIVGGFLALAFYKSKLVKISSMLVGLCAAIGLHALFNLSIMVYGGSKAVYAFYFIWTALIGILLLFEKVKSITKAN